MNSLCYFCDISARNKVPQFDRTLEPLLSLLKMTSYLRLGIPKGRLLAGITSLLQEAGITLQTYPRSYRAHLNIDCIQTKIMKPRNIVEMLHIGSRDIGFACNDWVEELQADLVELLDTKLDPIRIVVAAPPSLLHHNKLPSKVLRIASEYEYLTRCWMVSQKIEADFVRSYGATESFPPEDADCIVDNTATGSTLTANGLTIIDEIMTCSTRLYAHPRALEKHKRVIEDLLTRLRGVLETHQCVA